MGEYEFKQVKIIRGTQFSSQTWGEALEKFQLAAKYLREQCQVLLSSVRVPKLGYFKMLFSKGKYLAAELCRFSPRTHLSNHAYGAFQNKQRHYWLHEDLFKTTLQFLTHQFPLFGWKFHPFSWQRDIPACHGNCSGCSTTCTPAYPNSCETTPSHSCFDFFPPPPRKFCKFYEMAPSS